MNTSNTNAPQAGTPGNKEQVADGGGCCKGQAAEACCKTQAKASAAYDSKPEFAKIRAMDPLTLVMRYRRGIEVIDRRVFELSERQVDDAFLPEAGVGQWPVRVVVGHIADAELVFVERMRRAVGEMNPVVAAWDENAYVDSRIYGDGPKKYAEEPQGDHARVMAAIGGPMAVIHTLRQWTGQWLLTLGEGAWSRKIMHPERGEQTLKNILEYATWHLEHHAAFIGKKLDLMLGPAAEEAGGCGAGCGCSRG